MPPDRRLAVTTAAVAVRKALPPSAWVVLEELALGADSAGVSPVSSRRLAADIGMSKDTASRALRRLIAVGLVERIERRDGSNGQFGTIAYRVDLAAAGLVIDPPGDQPVNGTEVIDRSSSEMPTPPETSADRRSTPRASRRLTDDPPADVDDRRRSSESDSTSHRSQHATTPSRRRPTRPAPKVPTGDTDQLELFGPDSTTRADLANHQDD